jgi:hypothetical protein
VLLDGEPEDDGDAAELSEDELIERIRSEFDAEFVDADAEEKSPE